MAQMASVVNLGPISPRCVARPWPVLYSGWTQIHQIKQVKRVPQQRFPITARANQANRSSAIGHPLSNLTMMQHRNSALLPTAPGRIPHNKGSKDTADLPISFDGSLDVPTPGLESREAPSTFFSYHSMAPANYQHLHLHSLSSPSPSSLSFNSRYGSFLATSQHTDSSIPSSPAHYCQPTTTARNGSVLRESVHRGRQVPFTSLQKAQARSISNNHTQVASAPRSICTTPSAYCGCSQVPSCMGNMGYTVAMRNGGFNNNRAFGGAGSYFLPLTRHEKAAAATTTTTTMTQPSPRSPITSHGGKPQSSLARALLSSSTSPTDPNKASPTPSCETATTIDTVDSDGWKSPPSPMLQMLAPPLPKAGTTRKLRLPSLVGPDLHGQAGISHPSSDRLAVPVVTPVPHKTKFAIPSILPKGSSVLQMLHAKSDKTNTGGTDENKVGCYATRSISADRSTQSMKAKKTTKTAAIIDTVSDRSGPVTSLSSRSTYRSPTPATKSSRLSKRALINANQSKEEDLNRRSRLKTELCFHYVNGTECPYGQNCTYAHGEDELQLTKLADLHHAGLADMQTYRTKPCLTWTATGSWYVRLIWVIRKRCSCCCVY